MDSGIGAVWAACAGERDGARGEVDNAGVAVYLSDTRKKGRFSAAFWMRRGGPQQRSGSPIRRPGRLAPAAAWPTLPCGSG
jgi:hypothetical protein